MIEGLVRSFCPGRSVRVAFTDNSCTMSSVGRNNGLTTFRLHQMFREAPSDVIEALVRLHFVPNRRPVRRRLAAVVRRYIRHNASAIRPKPQRRRHRRVEPRGVFVNLQPIFDEMNQRYFNARVRAAITWSRTVNRRQMGCYHDGHAPGDDVIVVNRLLDDPEVPLHYLHFLVVHEILHGVFPRRVENGRTVRHPKELRAFERKLPFYRQAIAWEKEQVDKLYRRRKRARLGQLLLPFVR